MRGAAATLAILLVALPGGAGVAAEGGLAVDLPPGFVAEAATGKADTTAIGIRPPADGPAPGSLAPNVCTVVFAPYGMDSPLRGRTQPWFNAAAMEQEAMAEMVGRTLRSGVPLMEGNTEVNGVVWLELAGIPARDRQARIAYWSARTPAGLTTLTCATTAADFEAAMPVFRTIRDGIAPPG